MKKIIFLSVCLFFILTSISFQETSLKPYGIKSGIIEYSYSGNKVGKGTLYFDEYGLKTATLTDAVEGGEKKKTWIVTSGDYQYLWNPSNPNEGMKLENPVNKLDQIKFKWRNRNLL